jgi:hypothetical protein
MALRSAAFLYHDHGGRVLPDHHICRARNNGLVEEAYEYQFEWDAGKAERNAPTFAWSQGCLDATLQALQQPDHCRSLLRDDRLQDYFPFGILYNHHGCKVQLNAPTPAGVLSTRSQHQSTSGSDGVRALAKHPTCQGAGYLCPKTQPCIPKNLPFLPISSDQRQKRHARLTGEAEGFSEVGLHCVNLQLPN